MIIFNVLFHFSISEQMDVAFFWCMNTFVYKHVHQIVRNFWNQFLFSDILIRPLPERIQKVWIVFFRVARRDTLCLRWYDYLWVYDIIAVDLLCDVFLFRARFPLTKSLTKIGFYVTRKGPHSCHCIFKLCKRVDWQQESWRAQLEF